MKLKSFYFKKVKIIDYSGKEWEGIVDTYFYADENESGNESIVLKTKTISVEFEKADIKEIKEV